MKTKQKYCLIILFINLFLAIDEPFEQFKNSKAVSAYKIEDNIVNIDGVLDEECWENSVIVDDFVQASPYYGSSPSKETFIRILYDNEFLYLGVFLEDDSNFISCNYSQNDDWENGFDNNSDYFVVEIDSNHDHQTSYGFAVNCSGTKADYMTYNDSPEFIDDNWNEHWESDFSIDNTGWYIEYKIPFKILNYKENNQFGINFLRYIKRYNENLLWILLPKEYDGLASHYGHLNNFNIDKKNNFQFKPYFIDGKIKYKNKYFDYGQNDNLDLTSFLDKEQKFNQNRFGFDIKYLFKNNILFNYAYKPDFGQIEQHPEDLNFTNYEMYYNDKRPFFVENSSIFDTPIELVYTHDIGGSAFISDVDCDKTIIHASKIVRLNKNIDFGIMNTRENIIDLSGKFSNQMVDSKVIRIKKKLLNSRSFIGLMSTKYSDPMVSSKVHSIDGLFNLYKNKLKVDGQYVTSNLKNMYEGSAYNYEISYSDKIGNKREGFFSDNIVNIWFNMERYDRNFEINQIGFLIRNNFKSNNIGIAFEKENKTKIIIKRILDIQNIIKKNINDDKLGNIYSINWKYIFKNHWSLSHSMLYSSNHYNDWIFQKYSYDYNENNNKIIRIPSSREFILKFANNPSSKYSFDYQINIFKNSLSDSGLKHSINSLLKISSFFTIDLGMLISNSSNKFNFLKVRKIINENEPNDDVVALALRYQEEEKIYFSDSDILENKFTFLSTINTKKYLTIQTYFEYHKKINDYISYYELSDNDSYNYPSNIQFISSENQEEQIQNMLLYMNKVYTLKLNQIFKWDIHRKINIYIIYSAFKRISGRDFKSIKSILKFEPQIEDKVEQFYDESYFFKIDFLLGN